MVHGAPALVTAVQRRAVATADRRPDRVLRIQLADLRVVRDLTPGEIQRFETSSARRYAAFLKGHAPIDEVLEEPSQLLQRCVLTYAGAHPGVDLEGLQLGLASDIPVGRGMGSSAAVIVAVLQALAAYTERPLGREELVALAQEVEKYQHGHPSGVDVHACADGGAFLYRRGTGVEEVPLHLGSLLLVDTGEPVSSTGECVEAVRRRFEADPIWGDFEDVTLALATELQESGSPAAGDLIRRNHDLLARIGVVPRPVERFIETLHRQGYAAKVCGAGAVRGESAGMVLVHGGDAPEAPCVDALCVEAGYTLQAFELDEDGVTILS